MPAHRIYATPDAARLAKVEQNRAWRRRNRGRATATMRLMRWYDGTPDREKLRIVLRAVGANADEMWSYVEALKIPRKDLTGRGG